MVGLPAVEVFEPLAIGLSHIYSCEHCIFELNLVCVRSFHHGSDFHRIDRLGH